MSAAAVFAGETRWHVHHGDNLDWLRSLPSDSVDAGVTDPPGGIGMMGLNWDKAIGGRDLWIADLQLRMVEMLRVLKPGGRMFCWGIPRTSHWPAMAIENAGFFICDKHVHLHGTGFPHSLDISKAIDEHFGVEREVIGTQRLTGNAAVSTKDKGGTYGVGVGTAPAIDVPITAPATPEAKQWEGWGTAARPCHEDWILAMKPLDGTYAENVLAHGVGGINVDQCRVPRDYAERSEAWKRSGHSAKPEADKIAAPPGSGINIHELGGWPANVTAQHLSVCAIGECAAGCAVAELDRQGDAAGSHSAGATQGKQAKWAGAGNFVYGNGIGNGPCGARYGDEGGVSRFYNTFRPTLNDADPWAYFAKPSTKEREAGCDRLPKRSAAECVGREEDSAGMNSPRAGAGRTSGRRNFHISVKDIDHMRHLARLICPPNGIVIDPFTGSGTTGCACMLEGFRFLGCEREPFNDSGLDYVSIARARISHWERVAEVQRQAGKQTNFFG